MIDKFLESDDSMYCCELLKQLKERMISVNARDRIAEEGRKRKWDLTEIDDYDLFCIDRLNRLHDYEDLVVKKFDGEFFLVKCFAVDEETARRIVVLKSLSKNYSISVHEDLFLKELSQEEKEKFGQDFLYSFISIG